MSKKKDYNKIAKEILQNIGGKENIVSAAHCATRLRLVLNEDSKINIKYIEKIDGVKGSFNNGGQFQIILGPGVVDEVYKEFIALTNISETSKAEIKKIADTKLNPVQKLLKALADVFVPILPALVAAGLLMGIYNVLTAQGLFIKEMSLIEAYPQISGIADMINTFSNTAFVFLPVLIGFCATKTFGGNPILGAVIGALMIHPDLMSGYDYGNAVTQGTVPYWDVLGLNIAKVGYQGTVFPIIAASFILAKTENKLRKIIPSMLDNLLTPLLAVFITGVLTFMAVGPIMRGFGDIITGIVIWLFFSLGPIGGAIFGVVYPLLVITGMHHSLIAAETQILANMGTLGGSPTFAVVAASNVAQGAACLAVIFILKNNGNIKSLASGSGLSALLGITEPAMFGVNLKYKFALYGALIGSGVASAYVTFMGVLSVSPGPAGLPGFVVIRPESMIHYMIGMIISFIVTFIVTIAIAKIAYKKEVETIIAAELETC